MIIRGIERRKIFRDDKDKDLLCYWAVRELGISCTNAVKRLGMSQPGVGYAVSRGGKIAKKHKFQLFE